MITTSNECRVPNNIFVGLLIAGIGSILFVLTSGALTASQTAGALSFIVIFAIFGLVGMLKDISILPCPNKVLIGAVAFVTATAVLDSYVF